MAVAADDDVAARCSDGGVGPGRGAPRSALRTARTLGPCGETLQDLDRAIARARRRRLPPLRSPGTPGRAPSGPRRRPVRFVEHRDHHGYRRPGPIHQPRYRLLPCRRCPPVSRSLLRWFLPCGRAVSPPGLRSSAWWRIVGRGFIWLAAAVAGVLGAAAAAAGGGIPAVLGAVFAGLSVLFATRPKLASLLLAASAACWCRRRP